MKTRILIIAFVCLPLIGPAAFTLYLVAATHIELMGRFDVFEANLLGRLGETGGRLGGLEASLDRAVVTINRDLVEMNAALRREHGLPPVPPP
jgi:hypothetical protein